MTNPVTMRWKEKTTNTHLHKLINVKSTKTVASRKLYAHGNII